jgi:hypothetical protein
MTDHERELTDDEREAVYTGADTSRIWGREFDGLPETVSIEVALRLAEKSYRRGAEQGAHFMRRHLYPRNSDYHGPGAEYEHALRDWRGRGQAERYAYGELPPESPAEGKPSGFGAWLARHAGDQGAIGDLARDAVADSTWPRPNRARGGESLAMYERHLSRLDACEAAEDALAEAWARYEKSRRGR